MRNVIHDLPEWQVTSYGNGTAYQVAHKSTARSILFQGDDAVEYEKEFSDLTENSPAFGFSDALEIIWSGYADLVEDGMQCPE